MEFAPKIHLTNSFIQNLKANVIGANTSIPKSLSVIPKHKKIRQISPPMTQINATKKSLKIDLVVVFSIDSPYPI